MIQRIQSLFLFLVDIVLVVLLFVPFISLSGPGMEAIGGTLLDHTGALVGQIVLCVVAGFAIAMFKDRRKQMSVSVLGMILSMLYSTYLIAIPYMQTDTSTDIGTWISLANFLLFFLAWRFIKKDEDLVKSMDRLR